MHILLRPVMRRRFIMIVILGQIWILRQIFILRQILRHRHRLGLPKRRLRMRGRRESAVADQAAHLLKLDPPIGRRRLSLARRGAAAE